MRIWTRVALLIIALTAGLAFSVIKGEDIRLRDHLIAAQEEWVDTLVRAVAEGVAQDTIDGEQLHAQYLLRQIASNDQAVAYIYVTDFEERLFTHTFDGGFPKALAERSHTGKNPGSFHYSTEQGDIHEVIAPLIEGMEAHLHIGVNQMEINALIAKARTELIQIVSAVAVVGLGLTLLIGYRMSHPLKSLAGQILRYGEDGHDVRVEVSTAEPDIRKLADVFNDMVVARSRAESGMRESEAQVRLLLASTAEAIYGLDLNGDCTFINPAGIRMLGYDDDAEILGKNMHSLIHHTRPDGSPYPVEQCHIYKAISRNEAAHVDNEILWRKDGTSFTAEYWSHPIQSNGNSIGSVVTFLDITERKAIEEQLRRAQRMEAVGQLTGGVAHDFNNLLGVMVGNAELLEEKVGRDKEARRCVEAIIKAVGRGASLTRRLLAFSRRQALSPQPTAIGDLVRGLEEMFQRTLGETIELDTHVEPGSCDALIDPHQFEDALLNLAINARDAMPKGGSLVVEVATVTLEEDYTRQYEEVTPGDYVKVSVSDTGTGMTHEALEKAFEPFFTTKDVGEGSGLGLSMVYGFVKQSNGHVTIYSEVGHGTTVHLYLPRSPKSLTGEESPDEIPGIRRGSERILIVEDDEDIRDVAVSILRKQGYEIIETKDGREALDQLKTGQPFDLLFTDVILPGGMSGVEIAKEAKRQQPNILVLYTTGYAENAVFHQAQLDPDMALVNKPYRSAELLDKIREMFDSAGG